MTTKIQNTNLTYGCKESQQGWQWGKFHLRPKKVLKEEALELAGEQASELQTEEGEPLQAGTDCVTSKS